MSDSWICPQSRSGQSGNRKSCCSRVTTLPSSPPHTTMKSGSSSGRTHLHTLVIVAAYLTHSSLLQVPSANYAACYTPDHLQCFLIFLLLQVYRVSVSLWLLPSYCTYTQKAQTVFACSALVHLNMYLYSKGDSGEKLIYFYCCSDFKVCFRALVMLHRTSFDATVFTVHCWWAVKILPGKNKDFFFTCQINFKTIYSF